MCVKLDVWSYGSRDWQVMRLAMTRFLVGDDYSRVVENEYTLFSNASPYSVRVCGDRLEERLHDFTIRAAQMHSGRNTVSGRKTVS